MPFGGSRALTDALLEKQWWSQGPSDLACDFNSPLNTGLPAEPVQLQQPGRQHLCNTTASAPCLPMESAPVLCLGGEAGTGSLEGWGRFFLSFHFSPSSIK